MKTTSLDRLTLNGGLIIAIPAIMPHAQERSKQKRDARFATASCFPQSGMV
ncbi:hypothetical protein JQ621_20770 [Bradyrhizobium manausense]|uniref:hypothetical protein n=1 Tax=Bradyrhizobium manausense TaxID=989370 RepID=UPI001BAB3D37|nr:hypothetical protein [Bradyrhizobium manausense]MBR1089903.1 hypothetical protein [Bradyrhizobium manausense]